MFRRQRRRNIHWCYLNKFSSSFIPLRSFPHSLTLYYLYLHIILIVYLTALSWKQRRNEKSFLSFSSPPNKCTQHFMVNPLWLGALGIQLEKMMITIIIMNIFFSLSYPISELHDPTASSSGNMRHWNFLSSALLTLQLRSKCRPISSPSVFFMIIALPGWISSEKSISQFKNYTEIFSMGAFKRNITVKRK